MAANAVSRALAASRALRLPANFTSTHQTAGLPGFPATDVFGAPGTPVLAPVGGRMVYVHQIPWNAQKRVGGETAYLQGANNRTYFLTHLGGQVPTGNVTAGQQIGTVGAVPQGWWQPHIHEGEYQGTYNPPGASEQPYHPGQATGVETQPFNPATQTPSYQPLQQGILTQGQQQFIGRYAQQTGLDPRVVAAEVLNEESGSAAQKRQQAGIHNWLNIGYTDTAERGTGNPIWRNPLTAATASANWIKGKYVPPGFGRASSGVQGILRSAGRSPAEQIRAIQQSGWASSGYPNLPSVYQSVGGKLSAPPAALAQVGSGPPAATLPGRSPAAPQPNVAERIRSGIVSALLAHGGQMNPQTLLNVALNARRAR